MGFSPNGGNISGAGDVALSNPVDSQVLTYDGSAQLWRNGSVNASAERLFPVSGNDIAGAVAAIVAAGAGVLYIRDGQTVTVSQITVLPDEVKGVRVDGEIVVTGNTGVFVRQGTVNGAITSITSSIAAGTRTVSAAATDIQVGDWVFVASADTLPGTTDKLGYLRKIRASDGTSVSFDVAIPRAMPSSTRRFRKVQLGAPFVLYGRGTIRHQSPASHTATLLEFIFCQQITIIGVTIRDGGGPAVTLSHVASGLVDTRIDNFIDDLAGGHVGYGINITGATRDVRVSGHISRCRHAVTTNVGPSHAQFNFYGEPENLVIAPITDSCSDKALDSHRAGWGLTYVLSDKGSGGGVQVRADNVLVSGMSEASYVGAALAVGPDLIVPPVIGPLRITNFRGNHAITLASDAIFTTEPQFSNMSGALYNRIGGVPRLPHKATTVRKTSDQAVANSTSLVDVTELSVSVEAGTSYSLDAFLITSGPATADMALGWTAPAGATFDWTPQGLSTGTTSTGGSVVMQCRTVSETSAVGTVAVGTKTVVRASGVLTVAATGGELSLRFAQLVADAGNTVMHGGSTMTLTRI